jgi:hypothetical protein
MMDGKGLHIQKKTLANWKGRDIGEDPGKDGKRK